MKFFSSFHWPGKKKTGEQNKRLLLQQQYVLLHEGLETTAEVMEASATEDKVGGMFPVKLWLKLRRADGTFIYTHSQTLVCFNQIPGKGQMVKIKYHPHNLSAILILH